MTGQEVHETTEPASGAECGKETGLAHWHFVTCATSVILLGVSILPYNYVGVPKPFHKKKVLNLTILHVL